MCYYFVRDEGGGGGMGQVYLYNIISPIRRDRNQRSSLVIGNDSNVHV